MGFNRPSKIQETALPMLLSRHTQNLIAQSQSGTGKTAAFVLTMLSRIDLNLDYPQCLCLSPTYEVFFYFKGRTIIILGIRTINFIFSLYLSLHYKLEKLWKQWGPQWKTSRSVMHLKVYFQQFVWFLRFLMRNLRNSSWTWRKGTWPNCYWYTGNLYGLGRQI